MGRPKESDSIRSASERRGGSIHQVRKERWLAGKGADPSACGRPSPTAPDGASS